MRRNRLGERKTVGTRKCIEQVFGHQGYGRLGGEWRAVSRSSGTARVPARQKQITKSKAGRAADRSNRRRWEKTRRRTLLLHRSAREDNGLTGKGKGPKKWKEGTGDDDALRPASAPRPETSKKKRSQQIGWIHKGSHEGLEKKVKKKFRKGGKGKHGPHEVNPAPIGREYFAEIRIYH